MTTLDLIEAEPQGEIRKTATPAVRRDMVAIEFPDAFRAHEAMLAAARLERRLSIVLNDSAVITRDIRGRVRVNQSGRPTPLVAALWTASWTWFLVFIFAGPLIGLAAAAPAAIGAALWARRTVSLQPGFLRQIGASLPPGRAAACFLVSHAHQAHVLAEVRRFEGHLLHSTLSEALEREISEALASYN
jgi:uncharacterized membrane protein